MAGATATTPGDGGDGTPTTETDEERVADPSQTDPDEDHADLRLPVAATVGARGDDRSRRLLLQVPRAYRTVPLAAAVNTANAVLLAVVLGVAGMNADALGTWLATVMGVSAVRLALWWRLRDPPPDMPAARFRARTLTIGATVAGAMWGIAALVFFDPASVPLQVFLLFVIGGMCAGSLAISSHHAPAFYGFLLASLPPALLSILAQPGVFHLVMAALVAVFIASMMFLGLHLQRTMNEVLTLQIERDELVRQFRDFASIAQDWMWETGPDMRFIYSSGRVRDIFGVEPDYFLDKTLAGSLDWETSADQWQDYIALIDRRAAFRDLVFSVKRRDGSHRRVALAGKPVYTPDGRFRGYRGVGREIAGDR